MCEFAHFLKVGPDAYGIYATPRKMGIYPIVCTDREGKMLGDFNGRKYFTFPIFVDGSLSKMAVISGIEEERYCEGMMSVIEIALAFLQFVDEEDRQAFWEWNKFLYRSGLWACQDRFRDPDIHLPEWARLPFPEAHENWPHR